VSIVSRAAALAVVVYAFLAGFHTMDDPDMWWQMATGRYLLTTGQIARTEIFSYTAPGAPWIYPVGSGVIFHALYQAGGFRLLSLLSAAAAVAITATLIRRGGLVRYWTAALAVPLIATSTEVRANLFTMVMAACFLEILWPVDVERESAERKWWFLPPLMVCWVNLHPGFIYGLAMVAAFLAWRAVWDHRNVRPLLLPAAATVAATLVNPWGWGIYRGLMAQGEAMPVHRAFIVEWARMPVSWAVVRESFRWRDPHAGFWWLIFLCSAAAVVGLLRRPAGMGPSIPQRLLGPLILAVSAVAALTFYRFQGLFAIAAVVIAPDLLAGLRLPEQITLPRWTPAVSFALLIAFVSWRGRDLITNEYYFAEPSSQVFGAGLAPWPPERAARFIEEYHLPREIYHSYGIGGYLVWRLASGALPYPVFIDGRALPYGEPLFLSQQKLMVAPLDSPDWQEVIDKWKIRTFLVPTDRFMGYGTLPLRKACESPLLHLVYLDETAAVFVLASDRAAAGKLPALDCKTAPLPPPTDTAVPARFRYWTNAARLFGVLARPADAEHAIQQASLIFEHDPALHLDLARLRADQERPAEAEREYRKVVELAPYASYWEEFGDFLSSQERFNEARQCYWQAVAHAYRPYKAWASLAPSALLAGRAAEALLAADRALEESPFHGAAESLGATFVARMQGVRGDALLYLFQAPKAVSALELGLRSAPAGTRLQETMYLRLADAYYQSGRQADARAALNQANALASTLGNASAAKEGTTADNGAAAQRVNDERRQRLEWLLSLKQ
jgi:Flp pilus assembly protein TadD